MVAAQEASVWETPPIVSAISSALSLRTVVMMYIRFAHKVRQSLCLTGHFLHVSGFHTLI